MDEQYILRQEDLVENPTARVPICLVLDVSGSMSGEPIAELNEGVGLFFDAIRADDVAQYAAEIAVVTFGAGVHKAVDFMAIDRQTTPMCCARHRAGRDRTRAGSCRWVPDGCARRPG